MKKAIGQTVRDLKREVNKTVLKVPKIEQKVLDATSNEPWGPSGSYLAEIAQATRNYNDCQIVMAVLWKRINDTGKNWRHVYKALAVLEYLVAHGSERIIYEIREHAYQISTLSSFQYIDSGGRDQGSNVRKKSQSLVILVNNKERIQEVRQKADANKDRYRSASSTGGMHRPSSHSSAGGYGDRYNGDHYEGRYGNRDEDRNGYGRERECGQRDDDKYGRGRDSYGQGEDRYGRDLNDRYSRDGYRDDDYKESGSNGDDHYASRGRSLDGEKNCSYEDDDQCLSRQLERKLSEKNVRAPPSYQEAVNDDRSHSLEERDGGPEAEVPSPKAPSPSGNTSEGVTTTMADVAASSPSKEVNAFDRFDTFASISAAPCTASAAEMDLLGAFADSLSPMPVVSASDPVEPTNYDCGSTSVPLSTPSTTLNQPSFNPFGDPPFEAVPFQDNFTSQTQNFSPTTLLQTPPSVGSEPLQPGSAKVKTALGFDFGDTFNVITYASPGVPNVQLPPTTRSASPFNVVPSEDNFRPQPQNFAPSTSLQHPTTSVGSEPLQPATAKVESAPAFNIGDMFQSITYAPPSVNNVQFPSTNTQLFALELPSAQQPSNDILGNLLPQSGPVAPVASQAAITAPALPSTKDQPPNDKFEPNVQFPSINTQLFPPELPSAQQPSNDILGNLLPQSGPVVPVASQAAITAPAIPSTKDQPPKDKFEPKSTVWADTLSRGLVNLNISGPKTNPLADIGIDFDSINRKEKREAKSTAAPVTSTITMGKAMGAGSGIGRSNATGLMSPPNPMLGSGVGMGMGSGAGMGMGMGIGGGAGMAMGMGMGGGVGMGMGNASGMGMGGYGGGMNQPMGMNMGMGMGQGTQMLPSPGFPSSLGTQGGYNPMMGMGGYASQQPYGGHR